MHGRERERARSLPSSSQTGVTRYTSAATHTASGLEWSWCNTHAEHLTTAIPKRLLPSAPQQRQGGGDPPGHMAVGTAFALFCWGDITNGKPVKWLQHITSTPSQPDSEATELPVGTSYTLERRRGRGGETWELGRLQPKLALQYFYDWGNMRSTGAIYWGLPRTWTLPPIHWEQLTASQPSSSPPRT